MSTDGVVVALVGDVVLKRPDPGSAFDRARPILDAADVRFGNCEAIYSTSPERHPLDPCITKVDPSNFAGIVSAGFDVMSLANNHAMGGGFSGLADTMRLFDQAQIDVVGAGADLNAAMRPAIVERNGMKVAFLAFTCVYYPGFEATASRAGCATLRVHTFYKQEVGQPGTPPVAVTTILDPADKEMLAAAVTDARSQADAVIVSMHWGLHNTEVVIADYETELGRAAIDAGADVVFGHHQHILKGLQMYRGRPIVHGANQFVFDMDATMFEHTRSIGWVPGRLASGRPVVQYDEDYPTYPFSPEARMTMIALARLVRGQPVRLDIVPCLINRLGQPVPLERGTSELDEWVGYMSSITERAGLNGRLVEVQGAGGPAADVALLGLRDAG
ncbi:MAG: CapA family protein [Acidimicrobiia bacterium]